MNGLYKTSILWTGNKNTSKPLPLKKPIQLFTAHLNENYLRRIRPKENIIDFTNKGEFLLESTYSYVKRDPRVVISDGKTCILKTDTQGYLNNLTLMFRYCNCPGKTAELYIVKFEYLGDVNEEPVYSTQPLQPLRI